MSAAVRGAVPAGVELSGRIAGAALLGMVIGRMAIDRDSGRALAQAPVQVDRWWLAI